MKKTLSACIASALAIIMVVSATFAWFTAKDSVVNHLETSQLTDGSVKIEEVFTPPKEWVPGQKVTKEISVANTGAGDALVRVSFEEALSLLNGAAKGFDTSIDNPSNATKIPQLFNAKAYMNAPWEDAKSVFSTSTTFPQDLTVRVQKVVNGTQTSYSFAAFRKIQSGPYKDQYQRVTADFSTSQGDLYVSNVKYWAFDGTTNTEAAWAKFVAPHTKAPVTSPKTAEINNPITDLNKKIVMEYENEAAIKGAQPKDGSWWYNSEDGFFYYIGKLASGQISPMLLKSLMLDKSAGSEYAGMKFDLIANLESIQNTTAAILAADGWNLKAGSDLVKALEKYCV